MLLKLYYHPLSPNSHKVLAALYEKNIPFNAEVVDIMDPASHSQFCRDVNPLGKVPCVVTEDAGRIPESSIIVEYLDAQFKSGPRLFPADLDQARRVRLFDRISDFYVMENIARILFDALKSVEKQSPAIVATARDQAAIALGLLEKDIENREYAVGDALTYADISLSASLGLARYSDFPLGDYPSILRYSHAMLSRPSWQRIQKEALPYAKAMRKEG